MKARINFGGGKHGVEYATVAAAILSLAQMIRLNTSGAVLWQIESTDDRGRWVANYRATRCATLPAEMNHHLDEEI